MILGGPLSAHPTRMNARAEGGPGGKRPVNSDSEHGRAWGLEALEQVWDPDFEGVREALERLQRQVVSPALQHERQTRGDLDGPGRLVLLRFSCLPRIKLATNALMKWQKISRQFIQNCKV